MELQKYQNLRVYSSRLKTEIDEKYISVLMSKVPADDDFWKSRTGAMFLVIANIFFKEGIEGMYACQLGNIASSAFRAINHTTDDSPNIRTEVVKSVRENKTSFVVTADYIEKMVRLLADFYTARTTEKSNKNITNLILKKIK